MNRRKALVAVATLPVVVASGTPKQEAGKPKRLVLPEAGIRRIEKILAKEGINITGISISYSFPPTNPLGAYCGTAFLFEKEVNGLKIE